jgi:carbon monoxide dehydrogenase subunit G
MTQYESQIKTIQHPPEKVFGFLSDFNHFEAFLPPEKIKYWQIKGDTCCFTIDVMGDLGLNMIEKEPYKTIKYTADGKTPFSFYLWVQLIGLDGDKSKLKLTLRAELNPMLKMVVSGPVKKFLEILAEAIAKYPYEQMS